ncbi:MAG: PD40 domain-containing protein, partial [Acidobacteria bacterium]|nr:PD40 domain-containing protein [Acidobacteriota bacterium]
GSQILVVEAQSLPAKGPFWSLPVLGGPPRRLGDLVGQDAIWSPDDKWLAYSNGGDLFIAKADGTDPHKIATKAGGSIQRLTWSPDGTHLRFTDEDFSVSISSLWEVAADGSDMHPLLPGWHNAPHECCGRWTADGKFFVFQASGQIWALPQSGSLFHRPAKPIQLTFSPMGLSDPVPSKDGKKLFVVGATTRGELVRFDSKSGQFVPFLGGISAEYVSLSHDGQSLAYVSFPEGTLWRSKSDGSERQQLTYSSQYVLLPRWSPDDKEILFESPTRKPSRIYAVSSQGGSTRELMPNDLHSQGDPNWSPDGKKIVFAGDAADAASAIQIIDLATEQVSTLPGSQGMFSPRWSPDGRRIAAMSSDSRRLMLFDVQTQKWTEIVTGTFGWPNWSKDGTWLFAVSREANGDFVVKIRMRDHKTERVTDIKNFALTGYYGYSLALAPDDSPLLLKDAGTYDVYSLDWQSQ